MTDDRLADLGERLSALAEELADLALDRLREAAHAGDDGSDGRPAAAEERRLTRARRAVEKAAALLRED